LKPELEYDKRVCTEVTIAFLWANPPAPCRTEEMQSEFLRKKNEGKAKIQAEKDEEKARQLKIDQLCDEARSLWNRGNRLLPVTEQSKAFQPDDNSRNAEGEDADDKAGKDGEEDDDSFFEDNTVCVPTNEISVLAENVVNERHFGTNVRQIKKMTLMSYRNGFGKVQKLILISDVTCFSCKRFAAA